MTVLPRVRVFGTGNEVEGNPAKNAGDAHVVTLLVTPEDAEKLALATQQGRVQLIIRNRLDSSQETRLPVNRLEGSPSTRKQIRV
jgi:pilus assembly protein CpaB